ncbi:MAG: ATP-binding cassette domain-containing protein [Planctomycetaceae bacterium]|jgi:molybdate/tungstate transport system ATP-binding protein|nr:ATP-binding cassette domain-containing protein [Planctomycetaceae bacterium]MDG2388746.1 ATP-binding cassette domain-containing protein [Planctomycetaceae bacterium]
MCIDFYAVLYLKAVCPVIELKNVSLQSGEFHLENLSLCIETGEYAVVTGQSGCGKTTLMEGICGLRPLSKGEIWLQGHNVSHSSPAERGIGFVPQDAALFDSMTVRDQIGFALKLRKSDKDEIASRVLGLAEQMNIAGLLDRQALGLSGGEQKRVALARALCAEPEILCLDEPLSALDDDTRYEMIELLKSLKGDYTVLHITHNRHEVEQLASHCLLLEQGAIRRLPV